MGGDDVIYAVALTNAERELLLRIVREWATRHDSPLGADVLEILEGAIDDRALSAFDAAVEEVAP
jgi:hypothetical protein